MSTNNSSSSSSLGQPEQTNDLTNEFNEEDFDEKDMEEASITMIKGILQSKKQLQEAFLQVPGNHSITFKVYLLKRKHCGAQHPMLVEKFRAYFWKQNADGKTFDGYAPELIKLPKMPCECEVGADHEQDLGTCDKVYIDENDDPIEPIEIGTGPQTLSEDDL